MYRCWLVLLVSEKTIAFCSSWYACFQKKSRFLRICYALSAVLMEMPFEIQRGSIPAQSSHQTINKSTICGQKLKVKNTIHHEWKPLLKFTISFLFKQRVHLRRFSSHDTVDNRSDVLVHKTWYGERTA